jgi:hypothetical protein
MTSRMQNYRDLTTTSVPDQSVAFQFEFYCEACNEAWRHSPQIWRSSQERGFLKRLLSWKDGTPDANASFQDARRRAIEAAQLQARNHFSACACDRQVCDHCWDDSLERCTVCSGDMVLAGALTPPPARTAAGAILCPACQSPSDGARFCRQCHFDLGGIQKGCPGCGSVMPRTAQYCTGCGRGF